MQELKKQILTEISNKWNFEENSLLNDIPIAISEKSNNKKCVYMPLEIFDLNDYNKINGRIKQFEKVYMLDENENFEIIDFNEFDISDFTNVTLIESNLNWIINVSIVFTGIGEAISFGGKEMIEFINNTFSEKEKWIAEW
ncbi:hypothetical protein [Psychroserpens algicola]|uniref:hypothetical protein n=1 Tax=Psychroserpens algicola TaxID=1719034 RepID=UPI0019545A08|nr:hypothetical protein [Psychroserpens algicola]